MFDFLINSVVKFIGMLMVSLFDYFENDYMVYCVFDNVFSGLGIRFFDYVYINGIKMLIKIN